MTWQQLRAAEITQLFWESRREEMIQWLITAKGFNPKGAPKAISSFIDTMVFVAGETGEPQFKHGKMKTAPAGAASGKKAISGNKMSDAIALVTVR